MKLTPSQKKNYDNILAISKDWNDEKFKNRESIFYIIPEEIIEESFGNGGLLNSSTGPVFSEPIDDEVKQLLMLCESIFIKHNWNKKNISMDGNFIIMQKSAKSLIKKINNSLNI